jgi:hypothetical protein
MVLPLNQGANIEKKAQGSRLKEVSRLRDQGSGIKAQGSIKAQGARLEEV